MACHKQFRVNFINCKVLYYVNQSLFFHLCCVLYVLFSQSFAFGILHDQPNLHKTDICWHVQAWTDVCIGATFHSMLGKVLSFPYCSKTSCTSVHFVHKIQKQSRFRYF